MSTSVSETQVRKAVVALLKFLGARQERSTNLLEDDELLYLVVALNKIPSERRKDKPFRIPIPHPIYDLESSEICLIVKDHKGEGHKEAKARVREQQVVGVAKVVGLSKLKTKYESHEAKRQLCNSYDLFLADERVLPSLPKLIGKSFFKKKKQPIPVRLTGKDWGAQVKKACDATYLFWTGGSSLSLRTARASQGEEACVTNVVAALAGAVQHLPKKWAGVKAVYLKTIDSVALPVYQAPPKQRLRIS